MPKKVAARVTKSTQLTRLFEGLHRQLENELGIARSAIEHAGTKGTLSEDRWIDMLRQHLPRRYEVNRAHVIDSRGKSSDQIDVVVHDRQYSPFVLNQGSALYVPAESVYAAIEVKQSMNATQIAYAGKKIESVRRLHRTSLPIKHAGGEYPAKSLHHIIGGFAALESDWSPAFGPAFRKAIAATSIHARLDIGCVARCGGFDVEYAQNAPPVIVAQRSTAALAQFLLRLIARLQCVATVPCIDVMAYEANLRSESVD